MLLWLLACTSPAPDPLVAERAAFAEVERTRLLEASELALNAGVLAEAAEAIVAGQAVDPVAFGPLVDRLNAALATAPPEQTAAAHSLLYEVARSPEARVAHRDAALDAAARARYSPDAVEQTRTAQRGVTRAMALDALRQLQEGYVDPLPDARLIAAARRRLAVLGVDAPTPTGPLDAALHALWDQAVDRGLPEEVAVAEATEAAFSAADPWSAPIWPVQVASWWRKHDGVQAGVVGVIVEDGPLGPRVRDLVEGGSAWAAGLHQGDRIVALDGAPAPDADAAAAGLRGPDGTEVDVRVERAGEQRSFSLTRGSVRARTVFGWQRTPSGFVVEVRPRIGYLRIASFRPGTEREVDALLPERDQLDALVLDLRGNRGGDLDAARVVAERFIAEGAVIRVDGRVIPDALQGDFAVASPGDAWEGLPLAVLVDADTASSAEVLAGALQQLADAKIVGERTAGKGTSQVLRSDPAWPYALQYTNLVWTLPDGRRLNRTDESAIWGVTPDVLVALSPTERFVVGVRQAEREALVAHADGAPMRYVGAEVDPELPPLSDDAQLRAALSALAAR